MDTHERPPVSEPLDSTSIPIAQLSPDVDGLEGRSIHSTVTLLWPYSSSSKSFSLLLAEPDFRLRRSNGHVKVHFHGPVAEQVARTQVGIGDSVYLGLGGSRFVGNDSVVQTPGKGISWEIHFDNSVLLEVWRDSKLLSVVKIDPSSLRSRPASPTATPSTPVANGHSWATGPATNGAASWQSPAFLNRTRTSLGFVDSVSGPFVEEDGFVPGKGRKRPRFSMRSNDWRVIDEPESPEEMGQTADWTSMFDEEQLDASDAGEESGIENAEANGVSTNEEEDSTAYQAGSTEVTMTQAPPEASEIHLEQPVDQVNADAHFLRPDISLRTGGFGSIEQHLPQLPTDTPRLQPIPSPGLPIPSPLVTTSNSPSGYFTSVIHKVHTQSTPPTSTVSQAVFESEISAILPIQTDLEQSQTDEVSSGALSIAHDAISLPEPVSTTHELTPTPPILRLSHPINEGVGSEIGEEGLVSATKDSETKELLRNIVDTATPEKQPLAEGPEKEPEPEYVEETAKHVSHERYSDEQQNDDIEMRDEPLDGPAYAPINSSLVDNEDESESGSQNLADDNDHMSEATSYNEEDVEGIVEISEDEAGSVRSESLSQNERLGRSEDRGYEYEYDEEKDEYEREEGLEDDYEEEELDDERDDARYHSESVIESDFSENEASRRAEPEIIVLDSDSDDEPPPRQQSPAPLESDEESLVEEGAPDPEAEDYSIQDEEDMEDRDEEDSGDDQDMESEPETDDRADIEQMNDNPQAEEVADDRNYYFVDNTNMQSEATTADVSIRRGGSPKFHETANYHVELEEQMESVPSHEPYHEDQDSLEHPSVPDESILEPSVDLEPTSQTFDMAIDPKLYESEQFQGEFGAKASDEKRLGDAEELNDETFSGTSEQARTSDLSLQLDGHHSPRTEAVESVSSYVPPEMSIPPHIQQLVTPDASQLVGVDHDHEVPAVAQLGEILPTPELTQNVPLLEPVAEIGTSFKEEAIEVSPVLKNEVFPLVERIKEGGSPVSNYEDQPKVEDIQLVESSEIPTFLAEDQALQASIEAEDESERGLEDGVCLVPVDRNYPGLRSKLSYFAPLATLIDHYNALTDTISIVAEVQPAVRATTGKKDFVLTLQLTDPSMAGTSVEAQISRPYKAALPSVTEGDAVLLRNFRVKSFSHSALLVSESTSAWAVFSGSQDEPEMNGPPVEYDSQEKTFATDLRQWYQEGGMAMVADSLLQASIDRESRDSTPASSSPAPSDSVSMDSGMRDERAGTSISNTSNRGSRRRKSQHRRITIHELRDGRRYAEVGSPSGKDGIHELRDGTVYANL